MCWLRFAFEFLQDLLVELTQTKGFDIIILMHKLDAARNLVYDELLFFTFNRQQLSQPLGPHYLVLFFIFCFQIGHWRSLIFGDLCQSLSVVVDVFFFESLMKKRKITVFPPLSLMYVTYDIPSLFLRDDWARLRGFRLHHINLAELFAYLVSWFSKGCWPVMLAENINCLLVFDFCGLLLLSKAHKRVSR